jgi:predicted metal-binding membrane protein
MAVIAGAWIVAVIAEATGSGSLLHHHTLIEGGPPLWVALALFLVVWQVMIAAMMLPASLPAIRVFIAAARGQKRPGLAMFAFLAAYAVLWTVFGQLAFMGDIVLHHVVDATPWLGARPWLIESGVLALAGAYQFAPNKRRGLAACRPPLCSATTVPLPGLGAFHLGLEHGFACLGSSWALMLVMFAAGFANLWWMIALTLVMVYETTGRHGQRAASAAGIALVLLALVVAISGLLAVFVAGLVWK